MPWSVRDDHPDCSGYAVVKDDDGSLVACHESKEKANAQVAALYANEPEARVALLDEQREIRSAVFNPIDVADDGSSFEGYAAVFDEEAHFEMPGVGSVAEVVKRGAFKRSISSGDNIPMLYHHLETHPPLATTRGGTLMLEEDNRGLRVKAEIARGYIGDAVRELVRRGDIPGMSWGFVAGRGNSKVERRGGRLLRTLTGFKKILDVSPTWDPTYRGTEAELRSRAFGMALTPELAELVSADTLVLLRSDSVAGSDDGGAGSGQDSGVSETRSLSEAAVSTADGAEVDPQQWAASMQRRLSFLELEGGHHDAS